ncbi:hypothetical protein [Alteromonas halophila]|uniref:Uncharacterized protein n=1 Tax=Alteromonas halophila TaxID=516698 RepID=A0A918JNE7_9ALTE|nr:hypothetical protein [Alteromonas halophila]GGW91363.1 hypothetical protein GCM10007391_27130 [Alteromonas halophila]
MNSNEELSELWQSQPVSDVDIAQIKQDFRGQVIKQRCYMLLDVLGMLPAILLVWLGWASFSPLAAGMLVGLGMVLLPVVGYLLWLRRIAAFGSASTTTEYLHQLTRQMQNNARIAWLTRHSAWLTPLFIAVFYLVMFVRGEMTPDRYPVVAGALLGMCCLMAVFYRWALLRERRFTRLAKQLAAQQRNSVS